MAATPDVSTGGSVEIGGSVSLLGPWSGAEEESLRVVLAPFEVRTGITVDYTGAPDVIDLLRTGIDSGTPPDVADLPALEFLAEYAASGAIAPLDAVIDVETYTSEVSEGVADAGRVDGQMYGVFFIGAEHYVAMFNDTLQARALIAYLATGEAQSLWAENGDT